MFEVEIIPNPKLSSLFCSAAYFCSNKIYEVLIWLDEET
jgi:hypothetical protein